MVYIYPIIDNIRIWGNSGNLDIFSMEGTRGGPPVLHQIPEERSLCLVLKYWIQDTTAKIVNMLAA
jgi:hypothetical protein